MTLLINTAGNKISPQLIINLIKQYPIAKSIGYTNNSYNLKLDEKNITKIINKINEIQGQNQLSRKDIREMKISLNAMTIQSTLTDAASPVFHMSMQGNDGDESTLMIDTTISSNGLSLSGSVQENNEGKGKGIIAITVNKTSPSRMDYNMSMNYSEGTHYDINIKDPMSFSLSLNGYENIGMISDYTFKTPIKSLSVTQVERSMKKLNF